MRIAVVIALGAACAGSQAHTARAPDEPLPAAPPPAAAPIEPAPPSAPATPAWHATAADCEAAVARVFEIRRGDPSITDDERHEIDEVRVAAADGLVDDCLREMTEEQYRCIQRETTVAGLRACPGRER